MRRCGLAASGAVQRYLVADLCLSVDAGCAGRPGVCVGVVEKPQMVADLKFAAEADSLVSDALSRQLVTLCDVDNASKFSAVNGFSEAPT